MTPEELLKTLEEAAAYHLRMGKRDPDFDDIVQEAWIELELGNQATPRWAVQRATTKVKKLRAKFDRPYAHESLLEERGERKGEERFSVVTDPVTAITEARLLRQLERAKDHSPTKRKGLVRLLRTKDYSWREIGKLLGITHEQARQEWMSLQH